MRRQREEDERQRQLEAQEQLKQQQQLKLEAYEKYKVLLRNPAADAVLSEQLQILKQQQQQQQQQQQHIQPPQHPLIASSSLEFSGSRHAGDVQQHAKSLTQTHVPTQQSNSFPHLNESNAILHPHLNESNAILQQLQQRNREYIQQKQRLMKPPHSQVVTLARHLPPAC